MEFEEKEAQIVEELLKDESEAMVEKNDKEKTSWTKIHWTYSLSDTIKVLKYE